MRPRKHILAACICCGIAAVLISWRVSGWKATLRQELHRCSSEDGFIFHNGTSIGAGTVLFFRLPAKAATILEGRRREELLPYLSELQRSANLGEKAVVTYCICVVRDGLRGTPNTLEYTVMLGSKPEKVSVFDYCDSLRPVFTGGQKQNVDGVFPTTEKEEETVVSPRGQNP